MRELLVGESTQQTEDGREYTCNYAILIREVDEREGFSWESYGVQVTLRQTGESACYPDLTISASRIGSLAEQLCRGGVTPCAVGDVVADWL